MSDSVGGGMSARAMVDLCPIENERRMSGYDRRLLRPATILRIAWLLRHLLSGVPLPARNGPARATVA